MDSGILAEQVRIEIQRLLADKNADLSGRWLKKELGRSHTYWGDRQIGITPYNVRDVEQIANLLSTTPLRIVEDAVQSPLDVIEGTEQIAIVSTFPQNELTGHDTELPERLIASEDDDHGGEIDGDHTDG